ncbi:MAG: hypothetical protein R3D66_01750 [Alphaproteobacteria bacterium]
MRQRRNVSSSAPEDKPDKGTEVMQRYYWYILKELWFEAMTDNPPSFLSAYNISITENTVAAYTQLRSETPGTGYDRPAAGRI